MGEDKSFLPFGEFNSLIQFQHNKLSKIFSNVFISSKINKFDFKANLILDENSEVSSPMIALQSILNKFDDKVFIITVDTPLIKEETIKKIVKNSTEYEITIAQDSEKIHNLCGVFSKCLLNRIDRYINDDIHKINYLVKNSITQYISFNNVEQFININTANDYKEAQFYIRKTNV